MLKEQNQNRIPKAASDELHAILKNNPKAPIEELEEVLIKHKVESPLEVLHSRDRKRRVQRFTSRYRDRDGCRDVLAHLDRESKRTFYITIERCTELPVLEEIIRRLNANVRGLRSTAKKAAYRRDVLLLRDRYDIQPRPPRHSKPTAPRSPKKNG